MKKFISIAMLLALGACASTPGPVVNQDQIVREVVRQAIKSSLGAKYPGIPTEGIVDCVIDNATTTEINDLANATLLNSDVGGAVIVAPILQRPATLACLAKKKS